MRVPLTVKLSADDAVNVFRAQLAVPYKDPVILFAISLDVTLALPLMSTSYSGV